MPVNPYKEARYSFGEFEVDCGRRRLSSNGNEISLSARAFDLLVFLIENKNRVVTKDEILNEVWVDQFVEESNLTVQISALRRALQEKRGEKKYLATVSGKGYKFVADIEGGSDDIVINRKESTSLVLEEEFDDSPDVLTIRKDLRGPYGRKIFACVSIALVLMVFVGFAGFRYFDKKVDSRPGSIAVLPFKNQTGNQKLDYLADGLADSVVFSLSSFPEMRVLSRNAAGRYLGREIEPSAIGKELKVDAVLIGSFSQESDSLSVTLEVISSSDNSVIWGQRFSSRLTELDKLQNEISNNVSAGLKLKHTFQNERDVQANQPKNSDAFRAYIIGRYNWEKRNPDSLAESVKNFRQAIDLDPTFALAYTGLADSYIMLGLYGEFAPKEVMPKAKAAAEKALEIEPSLAEAYSSLALVSYLYDYDWKKADQGFRRSLELKPNYATTHHWFGLFLAMTGKPTEAQQHLETAQGLDPLSLSISTDRAFVLHLSRNYDEAIKILNKTLLNDPKFVNAHYHLGLNYVQQSKNAEAIEEFKIVEKLTAGQQGKPELAWVLGFSGRKAEARRIVEELKKDANSISPIALAAVYQSLGENETSIELLQAAYESRNPLMVGINVDPMFDPLRNEPAFRRLITRMSFRSQ